MGDPSIKESKDPTEAAAGLVAAERQRCVDRVLAYAALREAAAERLDEADRGSDEEKPSEGASERVRMQAEVARDIARFLAEETFS